MKVCNKCKTKKYKKEFYKNKLKKDGFNSLCKDCSFILNLIAYLSK